jgi:hypothetical protein
MADPGAIDYQGISILVGQLAAFVVAIGGVGINVAIFLRQGRMEQAAKARDGKIAEVKTLVDGLSDKRDAATHKASFAEGKIAGAGEERRNPTGPLDSR